MPSHRYEAVAASRPRIRHDVLFTETPDGVLFHNADGGFRLTAKSAYRFATLLVPHLDGRHTVAEICAGFGDRQRHMVGELVGTLYERGFARRVPGEDEEGGFPGPEPDGEVLRRYAAQIAYTDHYVDDAARRFRRFRDTRVAVLGTDEVARWCVTSLLRNGTAAIGVLPGIDRDGIDEEAAVAAADGCPVDVRELPAAGVPDTPPSWEGLAGYDIVVVTGGRRTPRTVVGLLREGIPAGRTLLPAWSFGGRAIVGPAMSSPTAGCLVCAVLRMGAGDASSAADVWSSLVLAPEAAQETTACRPDRPLSAMLGNLLGHEVFKTRTGALPAETAGALVLQDAESLDVTTEPLLPHPRCPWCAKTGDAVPDAPDVAGLDAEPEALALPTVDTARDADATMDELNRHSVLLRPHAGVFHRYDDEDITQTPLKLSVVEFGTAHGHTRRVAAADVHHVAGARLRALRRAAEVYAEHVVPSAHHGDADPAGRLDPTTLATWSGVGGTGEEVREWTAAASLLTKARVLVPAGAVRPFGSANGEGFFEPTRAGMAAASTPSEAAARGLLSALAYDAVRRTLRDADARRLDLSAIADPELVFLSRSAVNLGVDAELLDLGERGRSGVSVVLARSAERWTVAAELSPTAAASAALRDLLGEVQSESQGLPEGTVFGGPPLGELDPRALAVVGSREAEGPATTWAEVAGRLSEAGRDALLVRTGSADLDAGGVRVVRVLLTSGADRVR
ncbi:TOMM precursor leader peptide-binding protein [Streptomyces sp. ZYX-F-203]